MMNSKIFFIIGAASYTSRTFLTGSLMSIKRIFIAAVMTAAMPLLSSSASATDSAHSFQGLPTIAYKGWYWNADGTPTGYMSFPGLIQAQQILYSSDVTLKHNFKPYNNGLESIRQIPVYTFIWNSNNFPSVGFKAQEVQPLLPRGAVVGITGPTPDPTGSGPAVLDAQRLAIDSAAVIAVLISAVQQLDGEVQALKADLAASQSRQ
jgi:Chaperone of endosialidase